MSVAVIPDAGMKAMLELIIAGEAKVRLAKASITVDKDTVIGDFTEADFNGYAAATLSWGSITIDGDNNAVSVAGDAVFTRGPSAGSNTIYAWYLTDSAGTVLYAGRTLDTPVPMNGEDDSLTVSLSELQGDLP